MIDLKSLIGVTLLKTPTDLAGSDTASAWLDLQGHEGAVISAIVGAQTGVDSSNYVTPVLQESDTTADGDATSVAAADISGAFTKIDSTSEDDVVQSVGYRGSKRYVRVKFDFTGTISAGYCAAIGIVGGSISKPTSAPAAVAAT